MTKKTRCPLYKEGSRPEHAALPEVSTNQSTIDT